MLRNTLLRQGKPFLTIIFCLLLSGNLLAEHLDRKELRIGVLAKRGPEVALSHWTELANYLNKALPEEHFVILPLNFDQIHSAVQDHQIDLLLTNSAMFVDLSLDYSLKPIATLKRKHGELSLTEFGSVIFTRSDRDKINQLKDLVGQDVAAVDQRSLGGWIAAKREMDNQNIKPDQLHSLKFLGIHDAVVYAVKNKIVDVGIVRSDTLERMAEEGKINLKDFKHIEIPSIKSSTKDFPLMNSTRLYPEWPIASLAHVPRPVTEKISSALLLMKADSPAAIDAQIMGWTIPKSYDQVDRAFSQLKIGHYAPKEQRSWRDLFENKGEQLVWIILPWFILLVVLVYLFRLKNQLSQSQERLRLDLSHDKLTGLANRLGFVELANSQIHQATRDQKSAILLYLDLDDFKKINISHGRDLGDKLIKRIAERLTQMLQTNDVIARIEGDEFLILLSNPNSVDNYRKLIVQILQQVANTEVEVEEQAIYTGCSMGVSRFPQQGTQLNELIKSADIALSLAKKSDKGSYFISPN